MSRLTPDGTRKLTEIATRHGVSLQTAETMLFALVAGGGTQAQFNIMELGGMGQWSAGGMTMVGDMFNNSLKARVDALCYDLAGLVTQNALFERPEPQSGSVQSQSQGSGAGSSLFISGALSPWPAELGQPSSSGAQNNMRYAVFPQTQRLAIDLGGRVKIYDTGAHQISGVGQQQSGDQSLTFTSQMGVVRVADLPEVSPSAPRPSAPPVTPAVTPAATAPLAAPETPQVEPPETVGATTAPSPQPVGATTATAPKVEAIDSDEIIALIEKLAQLHAKSILTDAEFDSKKAELLARL
ncbi:hypothetical protein AQS8620_01810 [Aquimixticola soesokkakensis]|uniref:SHOCT domain-containing protein n=1 Tax=Aquimixticola soesokkakensis TaxID=1519096 RepID=A0A1Y5SNC7_9RHOB|nr:SHOCT domain-containing protein [Aquimixticola soesokkakensis]SLN44701.1 hypothetical protein AQS8620_01810 [Aquimixticola soesokkakensis]